MPIGTTEDYETLTVTRATPVAGPGGVGLLLDTAERGQVAFALNEEAIAAFRTALAIVEQHLRLAKGQTPS